jgi:hypothetical protein
MQWYTFSCWFRSVRMGDYVPSLCLGGPHRSFWLCEQEKCLMFHSCDVTVLCFISLMLCCAPSCTCLCYFVHVFVFDYFVMRLCLRRHWVVFVHSPSSVYRSACYKLVCAFDWGTIGDMPCAKVLRGILFCLFHQKCPQGLIFFCCVLCWFLIAHCISWASFYLRCSCSCFYNFLLSPLFFWARSFRNAFVYTSTVLTEPLGFWASFLLERFCLHFRDFVYAPCFLGFVPSGTFCLCFCGFDWAPCFLGFILSRMFLFSLPWFWLSPLLFGLCSFWNSFVQFCEANGWLLNSIYPWL